MNEQGFEKALTAMTARWTERSDQQIEDDPRGHCQVLLSAAVVSGGVVLGPIDGGTSDGYHTFGELYRFRMLYHAALLNSWYLLGSEGIGPDVVGIHKSLLHSDGQAPFPEEDGTSDWFIVMATLPTGQISNHYKIEEAWDLFHVPVWPTAAEWDGHTAADVADRLTRFLRG